MERKEKVFDLTREISKRVITKGISQGLLGMKFDFTKNVTADDIQKRTINKILKPILFSDLENSKKIATLLKVVSLGTNIKVEINLLADGKKKQIADECVRKYGFSAKNRPPLESICNEGGAIEVCLADDKGNTIEFLSMLNMPVIKSMYSRGNQYTLRNDYEYYKIIDLSHMLSIVYIANQLETFINKNKELKNYSLLRQMLKEKTSVESKEDLESIQKLLKEYNLPKLEATIGKGNNLVNWIKEDRMFSSLEDCFHRRAYKKMFTSDKSSKFCSLVPLMLQIMFEENKLIVDECERENETEREYASSYETKRNIPLKIQSKMNNNKFLKYFGEVEFDELCDLSLVYQIEKEFLNFAEFMNLPLRKDHSLRFRRLGKHKAGGLYFPHQKAVCVDIKSPSSMIHELMHMIDYTSLDKVSLSSLINFRSLLDEYKNLTNKAFDKLKDDDPLKAKWEGNSKYSKSYYHTPTEVFARCGEIYVQKVLGIDNSLVDIDSRINLYYPQDNHFLGMIKTYFESVLGKAGEYKKTHTVASSESIPKKKSDIKNQIFNVEQNGQLTLF